MSSAPKEIVEEAYDCIAEWYLRWVEGETQTSPRGRYTDQMLKNAPDSPHRGAQVVANDISTKQLSMAKDRCPHATLMPGDMAALSFEPASFDCVVSLFAIFHLPRVEQKDMLFKIYSWLKPSGMLVFNLVTVDEEEIYGEFLGHEMFWSSYSVEDSKAMVRDVGFGVVEAEVLEAGDGQLEGSDPDYGAKFMWISARKCLIV